MPVEFIVCCFEFALSHDPDAHCTHMKLGKVEYGTMNDQILMELMIQKINNQSLFINEEGVYLDVCHRPGVQCDD